MTKSAKHSFRFLSHQLAQDQKTKDFSINSKIQLEDSEAHHLKNVLRIKTGSYVQVFFSETSQTFNALVEITDDSNVILTLGDEVILSLPPVVHVLLAQTTKSSFCLLYTSPSPRDATLSRMPSSA